MKPCFDFSKLHEYLSSDKLEFECEWCENHFYVECKLVKNDLKRKKKPQSFCSIKCRSKSDNKSIEILCSNCSKIIIKKLSQYKKSKSGRVFCNKSCAAVYNNTHKTVGSRRSKLELWLEEKLKVRYPHLEILFNNKEIINSELDIYIPSLKLAVELNGIFHYEPIYGEDKLSSIINNDNRKIQACHELGIEIIILDVSSVSYFKEKFCIKYLDIITQIVDSKLEQSVQ